MKPDRTSATERHTAGSGVPQLRNSIVLLSSVGSEGVVTIKEEKQ